MIQLKMETPKLLKVLILYLIFFIFLFFLCLYLKKIYNTNYGFESFHSFYLIYFWFLFVIIIKIQNNKNFIMIDKINI